MMEQRRTIWLMGYPGDIGGACTEAWHTIQLWRRFGLDVHLIPTWKAPSDWRAKCDAIGCVTHEVGPAAFEQVEGLAGATVVSLCNENFLAHAGRLRAIGCRLVWVNCMTWLFQAERQFYRQSGPFEAFLFQSDSQRKQLEPHLSAFGYQPKTGHVIRGAFDFSEWTFAPRPRAPGHTFVVGRAARPDGDKWSSNTWKIYGNIQYANKQALMLGMNETTHKKTGKPPAWAKCLKPREIPALDFFRQLHCLLPINGGAKENWPRVGLEAMAAGVPIVTQDAWGWREMIEHGRTGFLGANDEELAHWVATLAYDEPLRLRIAKAARERLVDELASPFVLWSGWRRLLDSVGSENQREVAA